MKLSRKKLEATIPPIEQRRGLSCYIIAIDPPILLSRKIATLLHETKWQELHSNPNSDSSPCANTTSVPLLKKDRRINYLGFVPRDSRSKRLAHVCESSALLQDITSTPSTCPWRWRNEETKDAREGDMSSRIPSWSNKSCVFSQPNLELFQPPIQLLKTYLDTASCLMTLKWATNVEQNIHKHFRNYANRSACDV